MISGGISKASSTGSVHYHGVTFVGKCLFVEISDEDRRYVLDVRVQFLLLVIVDRLQIVLEELLADPSH